MARGVGVSATYLLTWVSSLVQDEEASTPLSLVRFLLVDSSSSSNYFISIDKSNFSSKFEVAIVTVAYENSPKMDLNSPFPHQHHDFPKTRENSPNLAALYWECGDGEASGP